MSASVSIQGLGYLGAAIGVAMVLPQLVRIARHPKLDGVSALAWALTALSCLTWLLYGVRADEPPQLPGNVLMIIGAVAVVLSVPSATSPRTRAACLAGPAGLLLILAWVVPPAALGLVGVGIGIISTLPQVLRSVRQPLPGGSAVSIPTWLLYAAAQLSWLLYAVLIGDPVLIVSASLILTSALVVSISELRRRIRPVAGQTDRLLTPLSSRT